jgi:hypothetical protein
MRDPVTLDEERIARVFLVGMVWMAVVLVILPAAAIQKDGSAIELVFWLSGLGLVLNGAWAVLMGTGYFLVYRAGGLRSALQSDSRAWIAGMLAHMGWSSVGLAILTVWLREEQMNEAIIASWTLPFGQHVWSAPLVTAALLRAPRLVPGIGFAVLLSAALAYGALILLVAVYVLTWRP